MQLVEILTRTELGGLVLFHDGFTRDWGCVKLWPALKMQKEAEKHQQW